MKGSQELPITLTTKTYDKALMSVSGRSWECAKESSSESRHVLCPGVCEMREGHGQVGMCGGDPSNGKNMAPRLRWVLLRSPCFGMVLSPLCTKNCPWAGREGCCSQGLGCSAVVAWVMEMAHTQSLLQPLLWPAVAPNELLSSCHTTVPSILVVTITATALYADFPWSLS